MSRNAVRLLPLAALALFACGGPQPGDKCSQTGFLCLDGSDAMECRSSVWTKLPCRGSGGCSRDADVIKCDMSADQPGDPCASTAEGKGLCSQDGKSTLECRSGVLVQTNACTTCTVSGDQVVCQP